MSKFLLKDKDGKYRKVIDDPYVCKYKINGFCCNEKSEFFGRIPMTGRMEHKKRKCKSKRSCEFYEKDTLKIKKH